MTWIKICGITNLEDAQTAAALGADALGFVFAPSRRRIEPSVAKGIVSALPERLLKVGVFVEEDPGEVLRIAKECGLGALQFSGRESPAYCRKFSYPIFKTIHVRNEESLEESDRYEGMTILLDTYCTTQRGGTGRPFRWEIALKLSGKRRFVLSGGLRPDNVGTAMTILKPWGVDVCSGLEVVPGKKDPTKMAHFIEEVRRRDESDRRDIP